MNSDDTASGPGSPRGTTDLVGHAEAERAVAGAFSSGRMHHAWLIAGPQGIGKATFAFRVARWLLADAEGTGSMQIDPTHAVARRITSGSHGGLLTIERVAGKRGALRSEIVVDDARRMTEFLHHTSLEGAWRIVVIDSADDLNPNAANALLKLIEEPPARSLLLLVSHNPGRLLPTIRSRCRLLRLQPLSPEDTLTVVRAQRPDLLPDAAALLVRLSEGRPGAALSLAASGGHELFRTMTALIGSLPRLDVPGVHRLADRLAGAAAEPAYRSFADLLSWWLARLVRSAGGDGVPAEIVAGEGRLIARLAEAAPLDRWCELWDKIGRLVARADALNLDRRQVVLDMFLGLQAVVRPAGDAQA